MVLRSSDDLKLIWMEQRHGALGGGSPSVIKVLMGGHRLEIVAIHIFYDTYKAPGMKDYIVSCAVADGDEGGMRQSPVGRT
jgi:hypothetical protein